jgi:hypothetical protein
MKITTPILAASSLLLSNCATIISPMLNKETSIDSVPSKLAFTITDKAGKVVSEGYTPTKVTLDSSSGYFQAATYTVEVKKGKKVVGRQSFSAGLNGWYVGNIAIGGLIGMVIVDPLTGAMYRMPGDVTVNTNSMATASSPTPSLQLANISTLSQAQRSKLVRI